MRLGVLLITLFASVSHLYGQEQAEDRKLADTCLMLPDKYFVVGSIKTEGNKVTRDQIILREMEFSAGDTLKLTDYCRLSRKSRQNLLNLPLFNFVEIDTLPIEGLDDHKDVIINVIERWYIWPFPIFELADRNFNSWWESRDFRRTNYGVFVTVNNVNGRMETLRMLAKLGYNQNYYLSYEIPYLTKKQLFGAIIETGYQLSRETFYAVKGHKYLHFRSTDGYARRQSYAQLTMTLRPEIHNQHYFSLGYEHYRFADTIIKLNPDMGVKQSAEFQIFRLGYRFKSDFRDFRPYPLQGHYFELYAEQRGFGLLSHEPVHFNLKATYDLYRQINPMWHWAFTTTGKYIIGHSEPYQLQHGLGYGNEFVRGYELYVVDGRNFGLFRSNLKYTVIKPKVRQLPLPVSERFSKIHYALYLNTILDAGYIHEPHPWPDNFLQNRMLYSTGLGLDLVTYYDLVLRFEYVINHLGNGGFYIHFVAPI